MDVIYTDSNLVDRGVLRDFSIDFDTTAQKDFQIEVGTTNNVMNGGCLWYINGTEYGGIVDDYEVITDEGIIHYNGRNMRGILSNYIVQPKSGQDYRKVSGKVSDILNSLFIEFGVSSLFLSNDTKATVSNYQFERYCTLYDGINSLCASVGYIPTYTFENGICYIGYRSSVDYTDKMQYDQDDFEFVIKKVSNTANHLICLGQGQLKNRTVIHLFKDRKGNVSKKQSIFGYDEIAAVYDYPNAADATELEKYGRERFAEMITVDSFEVTTTNLDLNIGDIIGGVEIITNTYVSSPVVNIIAKITEQGIDESYKVGEDQTSGSYSGGGSSSGGGGSVLPIIPTIGENGDWFINGDDTGKPSRGEQGPIGPQGPQGSKGDDGAKGDTGPKGDKGDTGAKGDTGPKGDKGDKGDTGEQGPKGDQGIKGDVGPQGSKGDKGDTGPQGVKGDKGDTVVFTYSSDIKSLKISGPDVSYDSTTKTLSL